MAELFANFKAYDVQATRAEARAEGKHRRSHVRQKREERGKEET